MCRIFLVNFVLNYMKLVLIDYLNLEVTSLLNAGVL